MREWKGFSIRQLGALSGVSDSYLSQIERGERGVPKPEILAKLAKPLGVPYETLMMKAGYLQNSTPYLHRVKPTGSALIAAQDPPRQLPEWVDKMPPEIQEFIRKEAAAGWPYIKAIWDARLNDVDPESIAKAMEALIDVKERIEKDKND